MLEFLRKSLTDRILELGGGETPIVVPKCLGGSDLNVDVRYCSNADGNQCVDFTANFDEPLPIADSEWDGVVSKFCLEHISHQKVPQFIAEVHRILKPGGRLLLITPNTEAQIKWILDHPDGWDRWGPMGDCSVLLFGQQDYEDNTHKVFLSPGLVAKLLSDAGFSSIQIHPYGTDAQKTDMVVMAEKGLPLKEHTPGGYVVDTQEMERQTLSFAEALENKRNKQALDNLTEEAPNTVEQKIQEAEQQSIQIKEGDSIVVGPSILTEEAPKPTSPNHAGLSSEERAKLFGRDYFDGGRKYGGYAPPGYRDFPTNEVIARKVLEKRPQSVLELGCGRGYVLKRLQDAGVKTAVGEDISKHAYMTRVCEAVINRDFTVPDGCNTDFDLCFSQDFWQYVPEEMVEQTIKSMSRMCRRGLHGINFGESFDGFDKLVCTLKSRDWWLERMPAGHEVKSSREMVTGAFPQDVLKGDGKTKLSIGGFTTMFHYGWTNIGEADLGPNFAQPNGYNYARWDCRAGIPCQTKTVDLIFLPHYLQRLNYTEGLAFLRECRRVLKDDGAMRVLVPNANQIMNADSNWFREIEEISPSIQAASTLKQKQWEMLGNGQQSTYDDSTLQVQLNDAGFDPFKTSFRQVSGVRVPGDTSQIIRETIDVGPSYALFWNAFPKVG